MIVLDVGLSKNIFECVGGIMFSLVVYTLESKKDESLQEARDPLYGPDEGRTSPWL